ncbi:hypothetical protein ACHAXR_001649 [Thalassiosira sp. AJA248-18]
MNHALSQTTGASSDAPFEWLTSFRSLRHLVLPSRVVFGSSLPSTEDDTSGSSTTASPAPEQPSVKLNALHVGCGTSTAGESLLCLRERTGNQLLQYGHVINVDNDQHALDSMQNRWEKRKPQPMDKKTNQQKGMGTMEWKCLDFKSDQSCRSALDGVYRQLRQNDATTFVEPGGCFDLVLDKSTLDCLLCAETNVVAQLLCEVYRALRVPNPSSLGGVYVLVTFHPVEFVERLLTQLPGADWLVEHEIVKRAVEDINVVGIGEVDEVTYDSKSSKDNTIKKCVPSSSAWSSGTFHPDENYRKTVNIFTCRRCCSLAESLTDELSPLPSYILDQEQVRRHIQRTCDEWYKTTNPMVTSEREEELRMAFLGAAAAKMKIDDEEKCNQPFSIDVTLDLDQCYEILFTEAEKEHLSFEYFLEDWDAYCERANSDNRIMHRGGMTVAIALDFLKEMQ